MPTGLTPQESRFVLRSPTRNSPFPPRRKSTVVLVLDPTLLYSTLLYSTAQKLLHVVHQISSSGLQSEAEEQIIPSLCPLWRGFCRSDRPSTRGLASGNL